MHVHCERGLVLGAVWLSILAAEMPAAPARAADTVRLAHKAVRAKIMREAGDRYDVQFLSTHADSLPGGLRAVTGRGWFRRRRKSPQLFTYHTTVNIYTNRDKHTGYVLQ